MYDYVCPVCGEPVDIFATRNGIADFLGGPDDYVVLACCSEGHEFAVNEDDLLEWDRMYRADAEDILIRFWFRQVEKEGDRYDE